MPESKSHGMTTRVTPSTPVVLVLWTAPLPASTTVASHERGDQVWTSGAPLSNWKQLLGASEKPGNRCRGMPRTSVCDSRGTNRSAYLKPGRDNGVRCIGCECHISCVVPCAAHAIMALSLACQEPAALPL